MNSHGLRETPAGPKYASKILTASFSWERRASFSKREARKQDAADEEIERRIIFVSSADDVRARSRENRSKPVGTSRRRLVFSCLSTPLRGRRANQLNAAHPDHGACLLISVLFVLFCFFLPSARCHFPARGERGRRSRANQSVASWRHRSVAPSPSQGEGEGPRDTSGFLLPLFFFSSFYAARQTGLCDPNNLSVRRRDESSFCRLDKPVQFFFFFF